MSSSRDAYLFLSANTRWVYTLAERLAEDDAVHAVRFYDWRTYWTHQPTWPTENPDGHIERTFRVLPPGYAGRLEGLARPFVRVMITRWRDTLRKRAGTEPYVVAPYPYLAPWVRSVPDDRLIYYNLDAYSLYRPSRADTIRERETELVERAFRTICLSRHQVEVLGSRHPEHADRIVHFPLGVLEQFVNPNLDRSPEPRTVGYVGTLGHRVDWALVDAVAETCSDLRFRFAGGLEEGADPDGNVDWERRRARALGRPNVEHLGRIPQDEVTNVYWTSAVNWIPYDTSHPFNKASCPTKIMDALASGRPLVSTPVPECELYSEWIGVADTPDAMSKALRRAAKPSGSHSPQAQVRFAKKHTWAHRAEEFRQVLREEEPVSNA
jgi:glycosyltransferase involved in cell wall biosynthesis